MALLDSYRTSLRHERARIGRQRARAAGVRFMAILPAGTYGYRQRATKFWKLGALALLPRATAIRAWLG